MATLTYTIPEAAVELRVSRKTVYRRIAAREIRVIDIAEKGAKRTKLRVPAAALQAYSTKTI